MLRNRSALSVLQKTYDESYLTCSTAIYYESQGNEDEATRCWKTALDQIRDHNANRTITNYTPRSETESALVESLRQLELQCKERIDLLEALRLSRQDTIPSQSPSSSNLTGSTESCISPPEPGWIGDGTIPAITYAQLSRPEPPRRPSFKARESSEQATLGRSSSYGSSTTNSQPYSSAAPLPMAGNEHQSSRPASPERHTMRTTLRSGKSANKGPRLSSSRPVLSKPGEEPSKAASLAWAALGLRDSANAGNSSGQSSTTPTRLFEPHPFKEQQSKQWDSNSRRLVNSSPASALRRGPDATRLEYLARGDQTGSPDQELQSLSITAASSALVSYAAKDGVQNPSLESERVLHLHTSLQPHPPAKITRRPVDNIQANRHSKIDEEAMTTSSLTTIPVTVSLSKRVPTYETNNRTSMFTTEASHTHDVGRNTRRGLGGNRPSTGVVEVANSTAVFQPPRRRQGKIQKHASSQADTGSQSSDGLSDDNGTDVFAVWEKRRASILKTLPSGVDEHAAKQILNEIVVHGDQVHWGDIAGLDIAKNALREAVVYPFLRPDLFMGLREPARGMLLFGPPGTGKTMLARAVATESRSTFFSISATSLTSKYLGESEKLVRALFSLAKLLAPSIIFVDEIDSLLSQRSGSGEHEATRRIKTEFLIQWSDLQRAAAGREMGGKEKGREDANRVLVLAATNLPWAIDEAARRRFVRRQYIPLPEPGTRAIQLKTLLSQQKHTLSDNDIAQLVELTDGFSGSDITALAKDAAMGPLRSVGDALLHMTMDDIRPIELSDFTASLSNIRPSVNKEGLRAYEDWAREFGERGA